MTPRHRKTRALVSTRTSVPMPSGLWEPARTNRAFACASVLSPLLPSRRFVALTGESAVFKATMLPGRFVRRQCCLVGACRSIDGQGGQAEQTASS